MSLRLDLLRHGETESGGGFRGSLDDALTARGWAQMRTAVEGGRWDLLVSSPLQRCRAFAEELAQRQGSSWNWKTICANCISALGRALGGRPDGRPQRGARPLLGRSLRLYPPGGEPLSEFEARVLAAQRRLRQRHAGRRVLLVTHGGVIRLLLACARGLPRERLLQVDVGHGALFGLRAGEGDDRWHECREGE